MRRMFLILVATALMVVLLASSVSPAFAAPSYQHGYAAGTDEGDKPYWGGNKKCVYGKTAEGDSNGADNKDGYWECKGNVEYGGN